MKVGRASPRYMGIGVAGLGGGHVAEHQVARAAAPCRRPRAGRKKFAGSRVRVSHEAPACRRGSAPGLSPRRRRGRRRCRAPGCAGSGPARREAHHPLDKTGVEAATRHVVQLAGAAPGLLRRRSPAPVPRQRRREIAAAPRAMPVPGGAGRRHGQHPPRAAKRRNRAPPGHRAPGLRRGLAGQERSQPPPNAVGTRRPGVPCGTTTPSAPPQARPHARRGWCPGRGSRRRRWWAACASGGRGCRGG